VPATVSEQSGCTRDEGGESGSECEGHQVGWRQRESDVVGSLEEVLTPARAAQWRGLGRSIVAADALRRVTEQTHGESCGGVRDSGCGASGGKPKRVTGEGRLATAGKRNGFSSGVRPRGRVGVATDNGEEECACGDVGRGYLRGKSSGGSSTGGKASEGARAWCSSNPVNLMVGCGMQ